MDPTEISPGQRPARPRAHVAIRLLGLVAVLHAAHPVGAQSNSGSAKLNQPKRIVSTAPGITETLFALGLGDRVVGVSQYCRYPPAAKSRPQVGSYLSPNVEVIARLRPDLAIVDRLPHTAADALRALGIPVAETVTGDVARNLESIREIGRAAGVPAEGDRLAGRIRTELDSLRRARGKAPKPSVLFVVGRTPGQLSGLVAVGHGSYLNELIEIAGGENPFAAGSAPYLKIALETVVRTNPTVIIDMGEMGDTALTGDRKRAIVELWRTQPRLAAVGAGRVYAVGSDIYAVPGPRMVEAARSIAAMLDGTAAP